MCWITSQNDTAPKRIRYVLSGVRGWITSQNDTAPKLDIEGANVGDRWITSQNDTAPKPLAQNPHCEETAEPTDWNYLRLKKVLVNNPFSLKLKDAIIPHVLKHQHR